MRFIIICVFFLSAITAIAADNFTTIPAEEYIKLLERIEKSGKPAATTASPPVHSIIVSGECALKPDADRLFISGSLRIKQLTDTYSLVPLSLAGMTFDKLLLDNRPAPVVGGGLLLKEPGDHLLTFSGSLGVTSRQRNQCTSRLQLPLAGTLSVKLDSSRVREAYHTRVSYNEVAVVWVPLAKTAASRETPQSTEKKLSGEIGQTVMIAENSLSGTVKLTLQSDNRKNEPLTLIHPDWIEIIQINSPDADLGLSLVPTGETSTRIITSGGFWPADISVELFYSHKQTDSASRVIVPQIWIPDAKPLVTRIQISADRVRLTPVTMTKVGPLDPSELNPVVPGSSADADPAGPGAKVLFSYKTIHRDFQIEFDRQPIPPTAVITGYCKNATLQLIRTDDGDGVIQALYTVKSTNLPFCELILPDSATILSIYADGQPVKAGKVDERTISIPLAVTTAEKATNLEIWMDIPKQKFSVIRLLRHELPLLNLISEKTEINLMYPEDIYPLVFFGNWDSLPLPRKTGRFFGTLVAGMLKLLGIIWALVLIIIVFLMVIAIVWGLIKLIGKARKIIIPTGCGCLIIIIMILAVLVSLGPQMSNMFQQTVNENTVGEGQAALSAAIYGGVSPDAPMEQEERDEESVADKIEYKKSAPARMKSEDFFRPQIKTESAIDRNLTEGVLPIKFQFPAEGIAYTGEDLYLNAGAAGLQTVVIRNGAKNLIYWLFLAAGIYLGSILYQKKFASTFNLFRQGLGLIITAVLCSYLFYGLIINVIIGFIAGWFGMPIITYLKKRFFKPSPEVSSS